MPTQTDVANMALDMLKEAPITSIDEARPIAMWIKRNFDTARDATLEETEWNFALKRDAIAADATVPAFGWAYAYTLPSDCIRLLPLTTDGYSEGDPIAHELEAGKILTDALAPLNIRYIYRHVDYGAYPATFTTALAARLALGMAHWLTGKTGFAQVAQQTYAQAINRAWLSDAVQGTSPRAADNDWVNAR